MKKVLLKSKVEKDTDNPYIRVVSDDEILPKDFDLKLVVAIEHYTNEAYLVTKTHSDEIGAHDEILLLTRFKYFGTQFEYDMIGQVLEQYDVYVYDSIRELAQSAMAERWSI